MDLILRIDLNIFSFMIAAALLIGARNRQERRFHDYRFFMIMLGATLFELAMDTTMWLCDGSASPAGRAFLLASTVLYYAAHPLTPLAYAQYSIYQVYGDSRRIRPWRPLIVLPALLNAALGLVSPFTGSYYYIDSANVYHHGPLFWLFAAASYVYMAFAFVLVLAAARRKGLDRRSIVALLGFPVPPAICGALQASYYGLVLIWPAMVFSLVVVYINIQQRKLATDYLTGAFNRRRLDVYLEGRARERVESKQARPFAGFMADVDDFKRINDRFGHAAGDEALVATVELIRSCLRPDDFLARYAGDEFVVLLPFSDEGQLAQVVERVEARFAERNARRSRPYDLSLSIGSAVFDPERDTDADRYIARLDSLMYERKRAKKIAQETRQ